MSCQECMVSLPGDKKMCMLCIRLRTPKKYIHSMLIMSTELTQQEINKSTMEYFRKNNKYPLPPDIDPESHIIDFSTFRFFELKREFPEKLERFKIFFTPEIYPEFFSARSYFRKNQPESIHDYIARIKKIPGDDPLFT